MPTLNDLAAAEADIKRMETEIERLQFCLRSRDEYLGSIGKWETYCATLPAGWVTQHCQHVASAYERSKENVALRNASLIMEGELRDQIRQLRATLKGIAEYCSGDDRVLGAIERLAAVRNTAEQALRALEQAAPIPRREPIGGELVGVDDRGREVRRWPKTQST